MGQLLLSDFKSVKKILIIYYAIILVATLFIYPMAGWVAMLIIIKIERDVCNNNALMGLPAFYKNFPKKHLYADEKNVFFYLVILAAFILWGGACFFVKIDNFPEIIDKAWMIIGLGMLVMIVCGIYHITWLHFFFKYSDATKSIQAAGKYYIAFALIIVLLSKNDQIYEGIKEIFNFNPMTCLILSIINICVIIIAFIYARKSYEKSEIN